jgi:hypothetical protein
MIWLCRLAMAVISSASSRSTSAEAARVSERMFASEVATQRCSVAAALPPAGRSQNTLGSGDVSVLVAELMGGSRLRNRISAVICGGWRRGGLHV